MSTYLLIHHNIEISFQKFAWKSTEFACVGSRLCRFYIKKGRRFYESWVGYDDGRGWKVPANCDTLCRESRRWVRWLFGYINFERGGTVRSTVKLFTFFFLCIMLLSSFALRTSSSSYPCLTYTSSLKMFYVLLRKNSCVLYKTRLYDNKEVCIHNAGA